MTDMTDTTRTAPRGLALLLFVVGYNVMHHGGTFFGSALLTNNTRVADWIDLLTPFAVLGPLAWLLFEMHPSRRTWTVFFVGVIVYVEGHGIHLSANSISNVIARDDGDANVATDAVHLWDEVIGHYIWYAGLFIAAVAVIAVLRARPWPFRPLLTVPLAALTGLTWATNAIGGGTIIFSLSVAIVAIVYGERNRPSSGLGLTVGTAGSTAAATLLIHAVTSTT